MTWPAVDGALALLFGIGMFSAINQSDDEYTLGNPNTSADDQRAEATISLGLLTVVAGISAFIGYQRVNRCGTAREEFARAYPQGQSLPTWGAPQPYPYPQQGYPQPYPPQGYPPPYQPQPEATPPPPQTPAGYEGGACMAQSVCAEDLVCASGYCVRPSSAPPPSTTSP